MTVKPLTDLELKLHSNGIDTQYFVNPHPDGKPWAKCCSAPNETENSLGCQCFMKKSVIGSSRYDLFIGAVPGSFGLHQPTVEAATIAASEGTRFFCCHRSDNGFHRECAGWAAKFNHR